MGLAGNQIAHGGTPPLGRVPLPVEQVQGTEIDPDPNALERIACAAGG